MTRKIVVDFDDRTMMAAQAAKMLVILNGNGVIDVDPVLDSPQVQMRNLVSLREITNNAKLRMERRELYTRYSTIVDGVKFYFISPKKGVQIQ